MNVYMQIKLTTGVIREIDERRSSMTRSEYVQFLLDGHANARQVYVTAEDLEEFRHSINMLIRSFLDFVVAFGLQMGVQSTGKVDSFPAGLQKQTAHRSNGKKTGTQKSCC